MKVITLSCAIDFVVHGCTRLVGRPLALTHKTLHIYIKLTSQLWGLVSGSGGVTCPIGGRIRTRDLFSAMDKNAGVKRKIAVFYV
jgi:hypothetical protein